MNRLFIKGGRVVDPANGIDGLFDVYVVDGKIVRSHKEFSCQTRQRFDIGRSFEILPYRKRHARNDAVMF